MDSIIVRRGEVCFSSIQTSKNKSLLTNIFSFPTAQKEVSDSQ